MVAMETVQSIVTYQYKFFTSIFIEWYSFSIFIYEDTYI